MRKKKQQQHERLSMNVAIICWVVKIVAPEVAEKHAKETTATRNQNRDSRLTGLAVFSCGWSIANDKNVSFRRKTKETKK